MTKFNISHNLNSPGWLQIILKRIRYATNLFSFSNSGNAELLFQQEIQSQTSFPD